MEQQLQKAQQLVIVITMVVIIEEEYPGDRKLMLMVMVMMMMMLLIAIGFQWHCKSTAGPYSTALCLSGTSPHRVDRWQIEALLLIPVLYQVGPNMIAFFGHIL
jgi:hypothetical protein